MTTNRNNISEEAIKLPSQTLDRGFFGGGKFEVLEGYAAIITEGGVFKEIIYRGQHPVGKYRRGHTISATKIDTRPKTLDVQTVGECAIRYPVPVKVDVDLSVNYRVVDPYIVWQREKPLGDLFARVLKALQDVVSQCSEDQVRHHWSIIGFLVLQQLKKDDLPSILGIEVDEVVAHMPKLTGTGGDRIADRIFETWATERDPFSHLRGLPPEAVVELFRGQNSLYSELLPHFDISNPADLQRFLALREELQIRKPEEAKSAFPAIGPGASTSNSQGAVDRMRQEIEYLRGLTDSQVENKPGTDKDGIPDSSYLVKVQLRRPSGGTIVVYFHCMSDYPQMPPSVLVELDGEDVDFESMIVRKWTRERYLVEVAREIKGWYK